MTFSNNEFHRLQKQCERMLCYSTESFVFLYSQQSGIVVVPALEVIAARDCNPHELINKPMTKFYQEHFECFIGDKEIRSANPQALGGLIERYEARRLIVVSGTQENQPTQLELPI